MKLHPGDVLVSPSFEIIVIHSVWKNPLGMKGTLYEINTPGYEFNDRLEDCLKIGEL